MRLFWKIVLIMLAVALVPLVISALTSVRLAQRAVEATAKEKLTAEARHLAEISETTILQAVDDLAQAATLRFDRLSPRELGAALDIIYRDDVRRNAVALIDAATGEQVTDLSYQEEVRDEPGLRGHQPFNDAAMEKFAEYLPLSAALESGRAVSLPYVDQARRIPLIALAVAVDGPLVGGAKRKRWVVAVEYSLAGLNRRFEEAAEEGMHAFLVDVEGRVVLSNERAAMLARRDASTHPGVRRLKDAMAPSAAALDEPGAEWIGAYARVERLSSSTGQTSGVIVERQRAAVLERVSAMRTRTLFWMITALVLALLAGLILSRGIAGPIEELTAAVIRFGRGDRQLRADVDSNDEIGSLGKAFNLMADAIDDRDRELQGFNEDLQRRVEQRTRELRDAQDELIKTQKAAAVGELGAGVAHEINNPLAAVLGATQLMLLRSEEGSTQHETLVDIEREALRIRDIVDSLLKLSREEQGGAQSAINLNTAVEDALALVTRPIIAQRIQVKQRLDRHLPKVRGVPGDMQQMVMALLQNARVAMPEGGHLTLTTEVLDTKLVRLSVEDTGTGIAEGQLDKIFEPFFTTRSQDGHKGMGLAMVQKVVNDAGGKITVESRLGKGTIIRVVFPVGRDTLHIA